MTNDDQNLAEAGKIRVLLVEDHVLTRIGLKTVLARTTDIAVVGEADNGLDAIQKVELLKPDVVLMDVGMPVMDGIEAADKLRQSHPEVNIIMLTSHDNDQDIFASLAAGAGGYCLKDVLPERLYMAIRSVKAGDIWLDSAIASRVIRLYNNPRGRSGQRISGGQPVATETTADSSSSAAGSQGTSQATTQATAQGTTVTTTGADQSGKAAGGFTFTANKTPTVASSNAPGQPGVYGSSGQSEASNTASGGGIASGAASPAGSPSNVQTNAPVGPQSVGQASASSPAANNQSSLQDPLSPRELEVLALLVEGLSNQDIADRLIISLATAKTHVRNILNKMAVDDRTQAAVLAMRRGLV